MYTFLSILLIIKSQTINVNFLHTKIYKTTLYVNKINMIVKILSAFIVNTLKSMKRKVQPQVDKKITIIHFHLLYDHL